MEICTIFFHQPGYEQLLSKVSTAFPKVRILTSDQEETKEIQVELKSGIFSRNERLTINYRQRRYPGYNLEGFECPVLQQMRGMYNFVASLPAEDTGLQSLLLEKIKTINAEAAFIAEPKMNDNIRSLLKELSQTFDAFAFVQPGISISKSAHQHFLDKDFNLLLDTAGQCGNGSINVQIDASLFDKQGEATADQVERKKNSERFLTEKNIQVNPHLPYVDAEENLNLRTKEAVIERVYALALVAAMGEGVPHEQLEKVKNSLPIDGLSRYEMHLYEKSGLSNQEKVDAIWRYESLNLLLWALGYVEPLSYPDTICDVPKIVALVIQQSRQQFEQGATLRSGSAILDELDKTYRMHWACVQARMDGTQPGGALNSSIVYERHYALNWLTRYGNYEWDEVSTDT